MIGGLFLAGGLLIYFSAEPFLGSLFAISTLAWASRAFSSFNGWRRLFPNSRKGSPLFTGPGPCIARRWR